MQIIKVVPEMVTPPPTYDIVGLTRDDMQALIDVFGCIGGHPSVIRETTDKLYHLIEAQGFDSVGKHTLRNQGLRVTAFGTIEATR